MNAIQTIKNGDLKTSFRENLNVAEYKLKEAKPDILFGLGIFGVLAGTVLACIQTAKAKEALKEHKDAVAGIEFEHKVDETLSEEAKKQAKKVKGKKLVTEYAHLGYVMLKIYGLPALLWLLGMGGIVDSHFTLKTENKALFANSVAVQQAFDAYRQRIAEKIGAEEEQKAYLGAHEETIQVLEKDPETGEEKLVEKKADVFYAQPGSKYARNFTAATSDAFDIRSYADRYLDQRVDAINKDLELGIKRFYTGNEIMRMLGYNENELSDDFIDVGISGNARLVEKEADRRLIVTRLHGYERKYDHVHDRFVYEPCLRLDFNFYPLKGKI